MNRKERETQSEPVVQMPLPTDDRKQTDAAEAVLKKQGVGG